MPRCIWQCITNLRLEMTQFLLFNNTFDNFQRLCEESEKSKKCVHHGFCLSSNIFDSVTSGIRSLCEGPKQNFIQKNEQCLRQVLDNVNKKCEQKCQLLNSIAEFSNKKDLKVSNIAQIFQLLSNMGGVCSASNCFLQCFREKLNKNCPRAGGVITDGLLRPFYQLASFFRKGGKGLQRIVKEKLPIECLFLTEKASLDKIVNPNK
ncbi:hypothetical protein Mgra_00005035, partial [Meloidogyne graminicola]